ncbi:MAG: hypothetical protein RLZZ338_2981 [Cyanobacteriota bacterium]|jgi:hypothetical protein
MTFLIVNEGSVKVSDMELTMELIQNLVGVEGESSVYDFIFDKFSDTQIVMVFDDNFLGNPNCQPSCLIPNSRELIHGQVLIVGDGNYDGFVGLTQEQIELVKNELLVVTKTDNDSYLAKKSQYFFPEN